MDSAERESTPVKAKSTLVNNHDSEPSEPNAKLKKYNEGEQPQEFASIVAAHYNGMENGERSVSRIYYLRNFHNWIKTILLDIGVKRLPEDVARNLKALDICCGKGGDLLKWMKFKVKHLICADIAKKSLEDCELRYKVLSPKFCRYRKMECEFIHADCTRVRIRGKYKDPSIKLDVVSCQFSFHYCFESLPQAECMLKNISECLRPGGIFVGTLPNSNEIVKRAKESESKTFKNEVYSVEMCCDEPYALFGAKYNFRLEGVVDCPEFLVHFPTFERLALKFGLKLVYRKTFMEVFNENKNTRFGSIMFRKMNALERYPPLNKKNLTGPEEDYEHCKKYVEENNVDHVGTLSKSECEVISLYQGFIFEKAKMKLNSQGYYEYEF